MKSSKKTMLVIAVTLLLAAALFIGAAGATGEVTEAAAFGSTNDATVTYTYWHEVGVTAKPDVAAAGNDPAQINDYCVSADKKSVTVHTPLGLGWVAKQLIEGTDELAASLTITFDADTYDMKDYLWLPLSDYKWVLGDTKGTTKHGDAISALTGTVTFTGGVTADNVDHVAKIQKLKIINTLQFEGDDETTPLGLNNNYLSGFIGEIYKTGSTFNFTNLTFDSMNVSPDYTYLLDPDAQDKKGYNQIGGIVGFTSSAVNFNNVKVTNSTINGSSKIGAFVGYVNSNGPNVIFSNGCAVSGTTLTGIDSVAGLIGYTFKAPTLGDTTVDVTINTAIYPESSTPENYVDDEMLGVVDVNGDVHPLWTLSGGKQDKIDSKWDDVPVAYVIKGAIGDISSTDAKKKPVLRAAKAELYNDATKTGTFPQFTLYEKTTNGAVSISSTPVDYVAAIGDVKYTSLDAAITAATAGQTVKLLKDLGSDTAGYHVTIPAGTTVTLDLNGFTINGGKDATAADKDKATITNNGTLTIRDTSDAKTGTIKRVDTNGAADLGFYVIINEGTLTIESGKVTNTTGTNGSSLIINGLTLTTAKLTVEGGELTQSDFNVIKNDTTNAEVTINGGTIQCDKDYAVLTYGKLTINDGTIKGPVGVFGYKNGSDDDSGSATINGGKFTASTSVVNGVSVVVYKEDQTAYPPTTKPSATIKGGNFGADCKLVVGTGETHGEVTPDETKGTSGTLTVQGGIFKVDPSAYLDTDYVWDQATGAVVKPITRSPDDKGEIRGTVIELPTGETIGVSMLEIPGIVKNVQLAAANPIVEEGKVVGSQEVLGTYNTVFITLLGANDAPIQPGQQVYVTIDVELPDVTSTEGLWVLHGKKDKDGKLVWEKVSNVNVTKDGDNFYFGFTTDSFSPFALVKLSQSSAPSKSSSTPQGSSVWLTNDTPAEPKVTPTPTPTPGAAETPSVKPVTPTGTPAKTPAPFLGILAGLGAAAVVFGLRRK